MKTLKTIVVAALFAIPLLSNAADEKKSATPYPLSTCVVSGEKLGDMGAPYVITHEGREVKLCCKSCLKDFNKEPAKFTQKIADAEKTKSDLHSDRGD